MYRHVMLALVTLGLVGQATAQNWSQAKPTTSPSARYIHSMAYDVARKQVALFGGGGRTGLLGDTWTWDGKTWTQVNPTSSPPARGNHSMAYDSAGQEVVLFGGFTSSGYMADTWTLGAQGRFTIFGQGCGPRLRVTLAAAPLSSPRLGTSFTLNTTNAPLNSIAAIMSGGISNSKLGPFTLPLSLSPFGMPGCNLYQSFDWTSVYAMSKGAGQFTLPIPNNAKLLGAKLHMQSFVLAPKANTTGLLSSNGGTMLIGSR